MNEHHTQQVVRARQMANQDDALVALGRSASDNKPKRIPFPNRSTPLPTSVSTDHVYPIFAWFATSIAVAFVFYLILALTFAGSARVPFSEYRVTFALFGFLLGLIISTSIFDAIERRRSER